jgi:metallophosphoesterase superfamily enzyme
VEVFGELVKHFNSSSFELVLGNHDIMSDLRTCVKVVIHETLSIDPFIFTHHPLKEVSYRYNLSGHLHRSYLKGREAISYTLFLFWRTGGSVAAFGAFTGIARIFPKKNDKVFAIVEDKVIAVHSV